MNHFKSKGSACWEDAAPVEQGGQAGKDLDYQGACENFRVAAAVALGDALAKIDGHKVILGDMNSYGMEDPMLVLTDYTPEKYGKTIRAARNTYILRFGAVWRCRRRDQTQLRLSQRSCNETSRQLELLI